ncbi:unnamed protein product [Arabidopsis arenosa]|uniref:Cyclic nucleotide-binding domain-containing protein n=1 Tax=Arabidopsis arenosa TaxID=38785 RepID=A0A8S1ZFG4_ARAAE|nr:unnamed protein product [Arabidopsis arenosa]
MYKSQYISGQREKFVRLDDIDSSSSPATGMMMQRNCFGFNLKNRGGEKKKASKSFREGVKKIRSEGLITIGKSVTRAVFPEDLRITEKKIFDPQDKTLLIWNRLFVISCILAVSVDPLFFYLPIVDNSGSSCIGIDTKLAVTTTTLRTIVDVFYLTRMALQFRTAYIAPSSRVFGRGELVIDPAKIAERYLTRYFIVDFLAVLPLPQIAVWKFLHGSKGSDVLPTKTALLNIVIVQYIPRFVRFIPLTSELKKTAGAFAEGAWAGAAYYLLWYMLASHITGAFWYMLSVERNDTCWRFACKVQPDPRLCVQILYCGSKFVSNRETEWIKTVPELLKSNCSAKADDSKFNYGIYGQAISSGIVSSTTFFSKFCYCLWWGLQNLSTLGQGLQTSTFPGEVLFSIAIAIAGLLLFALLIGNMQTYLQSLTVRLEEMRIKRRDSEQWMHHRSLPQNLRERVRRYDQYKWLETRGVDEENIVQSLPKDLRRDIKRHLCLNLVRRVPLFANMDERLLDAICERLKPSLYTESTYIVREGDPVNEMMFIIRGRLESVTTDGGRSGFFNRGLLKEGDFCGEELLTWALDPKAGSNLPSSTRTVKALTEVEAFALEAEELNNGELGLLASSKLLGVAIQEGKNAELRRIEEEEEEMGYEDEYDEESDKRPMVITRTESSSRLRSTIFASRFAANALKGHRLRSSESSKSLMNLQKPPEPDFDAE